MLLESVNAHQGTFCTFSLNLSFPIAGCWADLSPIALAKQPRNRNCCVFNAIIPFCGNDKCSTV